MWEFLKTTVYMLPALGNTLALMKSGSFTCQDHLCFLLVFVHACLPLCLAFPLARGFAH